MYPTLGGKTELLTNMHSDEVEIVDLETPPLDEHETMSGSPSEEESEEETPHVEEEKKEKKDEEYTCGKCIAQIVTTIAVLGTVVCIYYFTNVELVKQRNECRPKVADNPIIVHLLMKDNWYVFHYEGKEWGVPHDRFWVGKANWTSVPAFISDDGNHFSLDKEDSDDCNEDIEIFNIVYTLFGIAFTFLIVGGICLCIWVPCVGEF